MTEEDTRSAFEAGKWVYGYSYYFYSLNGIHTFYTLFCKCKDTNGKFKKYFIIKK